MTFNTSSGVSECHHGGSSRAMEKHRDSPRWKRLNLVRWVLGVTLFHLPWQEVLNSLILWSCYFFFLCTISEGEVRVHFCCGRSARINTLVWPVWNLLYITSEDILPNCSFVSLMNTLSENYVFKSISILPSKIRMKCFFSSLSRISELSFGLSDTFLAFLPLKKNWLFQGKWRKCICFQAQLVSYVFCN